MKQIENTQQSEVKQVVAKPRRKHKTAKLIFVAVVHAIGVGALVGLSVALAYSREQIQLQSSYRREMEGVYSRAYYNLLDGANDVDVTMAKLKVANTPQKQQGLLYELWNASTFVGENLSAFESGDEGVRTAVKFVNQLGDYCLYLADKLADGDSLSLEDTQRLQKMQPLTTVFKQALNKAGEGLDGNTFLDEGVLDGFTSSFSAFTEPSVDYPEMIYDGPFSDALETREAKGLNGLKDINQILGEKMIEEMFDGATDVEYIGMFEGRIPTLNYSFVIDGFSAYAQLSQKGGRLVNYTLTTEGNGDGNFVNAGQMAVEFAKKLGYEDMQVVWSATANGQTFVNLAPVQDGIILYPDLVKVKIDVATGRVVGFDSSHHAYNNVRRDIPRPTISVAEARAIISLPNVREGRLALIPQDETKETLCYEFECEHEGTYFIYINALDGKECEIFYVIDSDQGQMLM